MIIDVDKISKTFGTTIALNAVTCGFPEGATGLLGPNGSGKTTLLRILLGLLPAQGRARVLDVDPMVSPLTVRASIGYMPESECIVPNMFGVDVVSYMGRLAGLPARSAFKRAHEVMYYVGLGEERYRDATEYSMGMQQRLKLATALVHDPELLLLDEPTNGLDPRGREEMLDLIHDLAKDHGKHIVVSSHLLRDVEQVCTNVIMLREGSLAQQGPIDELTSTQAGVFEVVVRGDVPQFVEALAELGAKSEGARERWLVSPPEDTGTDLIFAAARKAGVQVRGLKPTRRSLEDVFMDAVDEDGSHDAG